jgi:hypothetical protein
VGEHVTPNIRAFYDGSDYIAARLALPLLWASMQDDMEDRQVGHQRIRIRAAFEAIRPDGFIGNPVERHKLCIFSNKTVLYITKVVDYDRPRPPPGAEGVAGTAAGGDVDDGRGGVARTMAVEAGAPGGAAYPHHGTWNGLLMDRILGQYQHIAQLVSLEGRARDSIIDTLKGFIEKELQTINRNVCK